MQKFEVGDLVSWESQSQGHEAVKCGTVLEVIKPRSRPNLMPYTGTHTSAFGGGYGRNNVSYLIEVPHPGKGKPKIYWPIASKLVKQK